MFQSQNDISSRIWWTKYAVVIVVLFCFECALTPYHRPRNPPPVQVDPAKKMRAESYFVKAREYEMLGLGAKALQGYEAAYALDPQSATLRDLLVEKYLAASQYSRALVLVKGDRRLEELSDAGKRACAGIYLRQGKIGAVSDALERIEDKRPEEYNTLGLIYESKGNLAKAAEYYRGVLKKRPESLQVWLKIAGLYTALRRFASAESLFVEMGKNFGETPELLNGIGMVKLAKGDTAQAINSFKMAVLVDSTFEEGHKNLAKIFLQRSNWEQAIRSYEKLRAAAPEAVSYGRTLAILYFYSKKFDKAWSLISELLAASGGDPELHLYGGLALAALDSTAQARKEFVTVIDLHGDSAEAWQQLCYLAMKEKKLDLALSLADTFATAMPRLGDAWRLEGYVLNARREYARAAGALQKAIAIDSADALAWFEFGMSLERSNKKPDAALAFHRVLSLRPGDPPAANYLAYMWAEQGIKLDSARTLLAMALKKDSTNGAYLDSYAWIFYKMGSFDTAKAYIVKALGRITDDPVVYSHFGDILAKTGDYSGALAAYRKGLACALPDKATEEEIADLKKKLGEMENIQKRSSQPAGK